MLDASIGLMVVEVVVAVGVLAVQADKQKHF